MGVSRLFWKAYFRQSLGVPWWVGPQRETKFKGPAEALPIISQDFIFVTPNLESEDELRKMLERMIVAIRQDPENLFCLSSNDPDYIQACIGPLEPHQKVMFFGSQNLRTAGTLGTWFSISKAQCMVTHELKDLKINPRLKKQTWNHLQTYAGIQ